MSDTQQCVRCNSPYDKAYSAKYDAYYCVVCDRWIETRCPDPTCEFCTRRPRRPSDS